MFASSTTTGFSTVSPWPRHWPRWRRCCWARSWRSFGASRGPPPERARGAQPRQLCDAAGPCDRQEWEDAGMELTRVAVLLAACTTWASFAVCMRCYFRDARRAHPAKTWLTRCAFACTLAQVAALAWPDTPGPLLAWSGIACFAVAQSLFWWALAVHGRRRPSFAFVPVVPTCLVQGGPYR